MSFRILKKVLLITAILAPALLHSAEIYIVHSFSYGPFQEISAGIKAALPQSDIKDIVLNGEEIEDIIEDDPLNICITLGEKAFEQINKATTKIQLVVMMNYNMPERGIPERKTKIIPPDMGLLGKIRILKEVIPYMKGVIVPCSGGWYEENHDDLTKKLKQIGVDLQFVITGEDTGEFFQSLKVPEGYLLMAVYDSKVYNKESIYNILEFTFKKRIPFIGLTRGFVKSGAYLSVVPDYYSMGLDAGLFLIDDSASMLSLENIEYSIFVNPNIMKLVNMKLVSSKKIKFLR